MTPEMESLIEESRKRGEAARSLYGRFCASLDGLADTPTNDLQGALSVAKGAQNGPVQYALRRELILRSERGESIALRPSV